MSLRFALLGLLADRPSSGYDLTQRFAEGIGMFAWAAWHSQIYPELKKLDSDGLVDVGSTGARGRKVYELTPTGRAELRRWLLDPSAERGTVRNDFVLRLFLISTLDPDDARQLLAGISTYAEEQISLLEKERDELTDPTSGGAFAAAYGLYAYAATRDWARWATDQLGSR